MEYVVYILRSLKTGRFYCGHTHDLFSRFLRHNRGDTVSTRSGIPWVLVWWEYHATRSSAVRRERWIKGRGIGRFLKEQGVL
ncbi:MAG: GIY-YIG nuclease family protein [Calditrichaeota bacterium]|nr:GIY-YIG nuclease family protein [Calditrichota bacterium]